MNDLTFDIMLNMIRESIPFSYARFGDGEWNAILQKKPGGRNCDGHEYFPELGQALRRVLEERPDYYLGLQNLAREQNTGNKEFDWLVALNHWTDNEILHRASIKGRLKEFFAALTGCRVIMVGNPSLANVPFRYDWLIEIPVNDCWTKYELTKASIGSFIKRGDVVLYSASMMSEVLIHDFKDAGITQIDCGSVFDPYVGKQTRTYHKNLHLN